MIKIKGNRWYKCDFHIHSTASECFKNKEVTPQQFLEEFKKKELDCVAITDHNTVKGIDELRDICKENGITLFPGVELTCGDSKTHLLILFDTEKKIIEIEDFILSTGVKREQLGRKDAYSEKGIIDIIKLAKENNAIVIPAHIDDYSGLIGVSNQRRNEILRQENIYVAQMVKEDLININSKDLGGIDHKKSLVKSYLEVNDINVKDYIACAKAVREENLGIVTFSDNPSEAGSSKHGLWGIGENFTWIKMGEIPSLESLRQAFILSEYRVRNGIEYDESPYEEPNIWINKLKLSDSELNSSEEFNIEFSPQLTTVIGGRGSGKSSIVRLITGVLNKNSIAEEFADIYKEFNQFFQIKNKALGILKKSTIIEIYIIKNKVQYKVKAYNFRNKNEHDISINKYENLNGRFIEMKDIKICDLFEIDIYNQKQIYELAKKTNILRDNIDSIIPEIKKLYQEKKQLYKKYKAEFSSIQANKKDVRIKKKIKLEIEDINEKIDLYNKSKINENLSIYREFENESNLISSILKSMSSNKDFVVEALNKIKIPTIQLDSVRAKYKEELEACLRIIQEDFSKIIKKINLANEELKNLDNVFKDQLRSSDWLKEYKKSKESYENTLNKLNSKGIMKNEINNLFNLLNVKENELREIEKKEELIKDEYKRLEEYKEKYINKCIHIFDTRKKFIEHLLKDTNIKIELKEFRDKNNFEQKLRQIIQKDSAYEKDINYILKKIFTKDIIENIRLMNEEFLAIREERKTINEYSGKFCNIIRGLNNEQIAELNLLVPEDEIRVQYKKKGSKGYKSLLNASAGQRTSAILTFILAYGKIPLILDQPEDDLDNHLIYDLIVERLKQSKEKRQIIVVTHNANIPVNGDAELIVAMNSQSKDVKIKTIGTLEENEVKEEICNVMEGGEHAFKLRAQRYGII